MHINKRVVAAITLIVFALGMVFGGALSVFAAENTAEPAATVETDSEADATAKDAEPEVVAPEQKAPTQKVSGVTVTVNSEWYESDGKTAYTGDKPLGVTYELYEGSVGNYTGSWIAIGTNFPSVGKNTCELRFTPEEGKSYVVVEKFDNGAEGFVEAREQALTDTKNSSSLTFKHSKMPWMRVSGTVNLDGKAPTSHHFTFTLTDDKTGKLVQETKSLNQGFTFKPVNFEKNGSYSYTLKQVVPAEAAGLVYDEAVYKIICNVDGQNVTKTITKDGAPYSGEPVFNNKTDVNNPVNLTVKVKWANDNASDRPKEVEVQLYYKETQKDGKTTKDEPEGKSVKISAADNWTYTWENLDGDKTWVVKEVKVPSGYSANVIDEGKSGDTLNYTILNGKGGTVVPASGGSSGKAGTAAAPVNVSSRGTPQTNDISHLNAWITFATISLSGMLLMALLLFLNRKKAFEKK